MMSMPQLVHTAFSAMACGEDTVGEETPDTEDTEEDAHDTSSKRSRAALWRHEGNVTA